MSTEQSPIAGLPYDQARQHFRAKVFCESSGPLGENILGHSFGDDLKLCLVIDLPNSIMTVPVEDTERFVESERQILEDAVKNTEDTELHELPCGIISKGPLSGGRIVSDPANSYVCLFAYRPQALFEDVHEDILFIVPSRSFEVAYPVRGTVSRKVIQELMTLSENIYTTEEGAISISLYWQHGLVARRLELERGALVTPNWDLFQSVFQVR
jgi:hypothetical protein